MKGEEHSLIVTETGTGLRVSMLPGGVNQASMIGPSSSRNQALFNSAAQELSSEPSLPKLNKLDPMKESLRSDLRRSDSHNSATGM